MDAENRRRLRRGRRIRPPFKKKNRHAIRRNDFLGGGRWIRTTEVTDNRFTVCPLWPLGNSPIFTCALKRKLGAGRRTRTPDLLITNQLLYQLSYTSISATEWILADAAPFVKPKFFIFREGRLVILNAKEQIPRRMTGTRSIAFIFLPSTELKHNRNGVKWCGSTDT